MAKPAKQTVVFSHKCEGCGQPLPLNEKGVPVTSLYLNTHWLCPDCKFKPNIRRKFT